MGQQHFVPPLLQGAAGFSQSLQHMSAQRQQDWVQPPPHRLVEQASTPPHRSYLDSGEPGLGEKAGQELSHGWRQAGSCIGGAAPVRGGEADELDF